MSGDRIDVTGFFGLAVPSRWWLDYAPTHGYGSSDRSGQDVRRRGRGERPELRSEGRGVPHAGRPQRLWQNHHFAAGRRTGKTRSRRGLPRRPDAVRGGLGTLRAAGAARHGDGLPELRDLAAHDGLRKRGVSAARAPRASRGAPRSGDGDPRHGRAGRSPRPPRAHAVRRPAAAGGAGAGPGVGEFEDSGCVLPVDVAEAWRDGQEVLLAFRPGAAEVRAAERDGAWVGVVRSSVYVSGHVEYVVDLGKFTVRATGPEDPRLPHDARARLHVSPRAVRVWPRGADESAGANGGRPR